MLFDCDASVTCGYVAVTFRGVLKRFKYTKGTSFEEFLFIFLLLGNPSLCYVFTYVRMTLIVFFAVIMRTYVSNFCFELVAANNFNVQIPRIYSLQLKAAR